MTCKQVVQNEQKINPKFRMLIKNDFKLLNTVFIIGSKDFFDQLDLFCHLIILFIDLVRLDDFFYFLFDLNILRVENHLIYAFGKNFLQTSTQVTLLLISYRN